MVGVVDGWVVGLSKTIDINFWRWTENLNKYFERGTDNFDIIWKGDGQPKYVL